MIDRVRNIPYSPPKDFLRGDRKVSGIREQATLTSKGQITLPKAIRQALGVSQGGKLTFELRGEEIVVSRSDEPHRDPAIGAFLALLEADIRQGRNIGSLPEELVDAMLEAAESDSVDDQDIEGEVDI